MPIYKTECIILRRFSIRETSLVAVLFTERFGKVHGLFKGIRNDPKKFASSVDIFSVNDIVFYKSRSSNLHLVSQCELKSAMFNASWGRPKIEAAGYVLRLTELLLPQWQKNPGLYSLLKDTLSMITYVDDPNYVFTAYDIKALKISGFQPHIDSCVSCRRDIEGESFFSVKQGGILCAGCRHKDMGAREVNPGVIRAIRQIGSMHISKCNVLKLSKPMYNELTDLVHRFLEYHLDVRAQYVPKKAGVIC